MQAIHQSADTMPRFFNRTCWWMILACFCCVAAGAKAGDAVLMEFSSVQCGPCQAMKPIVSELIARGVPVRQVDVQAEPQLTRRYGIRSTPTYVVLREGREVTRLLGVQSAAEISTALTQNLSGPLIPTRSNSVAGGFDEPQTRLAPITSGQNAVDHSPRRAIRQDNGRSDTFDQQLIRQPNRSSDWNTTADLPETDAAMEAMPSLSLADAIEKAKAATVRLRVFDGRGYGAGTGTIVDAHGDEALVLTCGHLFRDGEGKDRIEVDLFVAGEVRTVVGKIVDFDAGDRDIGLVAIRPGFPVSPVKVIQEGESVRVGQTAFSFGCDRGDDPSRRDTRITGVNKYNQNIGASNLEIDGAPIDGRSGGGLFDDRGVLIGVCNAADYKSDLGIYTGPGSVHWQLGRVKLGRLFQGTPAAALVGSPSNSNNENNVAFENNNAMQNNALPRMPRPAAPTATTEMIVILRDSSGQQREQIMTFSQPDADLVERIRQAAMSR